MREKKKYFDKEVIVTALKLTVVVAAVVLMLAVVNSLTADRIAENEAAEGNAARQTLVADAQSFDLVNVSDLPSGATGTVRAVYRAVNADGETIAYCVDVTAMGFGSDGIGMVVAVSASGEVLGARVTSSAETSGIGSKVVDQTNQTGQVEAVSGATVTSKGLANGVALAQETVKNLEGGV